MFNLLPQQSVSVTTCREGSYSSGLEKVAVSGSHTFILGVGVRPGQYSVLCKVDGKTIFSHSHSEYRTFLCIHVYISLKCLLVE